MSKNTERGMGHHAGPVADGRPDEVPRAASERPAAPVVPADGGEGVPVRPQRSDAGQVTLLGVSAPVFERGKVAVTAPGRDVHLPVEARRAPAPRPIAGEGGGSPVALPPQRRTPDPPVRTLVDPTPAATVRISKTKIITPVLGTAPERSPHEKGGGFPVGRRQPAPPDDLEESGISSGVRGPVVLGIGLSLVLALIVVGLARFGPHVRTASPVQPFEGRPDPRLDSPPLGAPAPAPEGPGTTAAGRPPSVGDDSTRGGEAAPAAEPPSSAVAGGSPGDVPAEAIPGGPRPLPGSRARAAPPDTRTPPPVFNEIGEARPANNVVDRNLRRPSVRPRALAPVADRAAGSPGAGGVITPGPRRSPGRAFDGQSGSVGASGTSPVTPNGLSPGPSPSPFQPPPLTPPRAPSSRGDESKAPYDPDSPLPPASE
jgi:hypothetical protein